MTLMAAMVLTARRRLMTFLLAAIASLILRFHMLAAGAFGLFGGRAGVSRQRGHGNGQRERAGKHPKYHHHSPNELILKPKASAHSWRRCGGLRVVADQPHQCAHRRGLTRIERGNYGGTGNGDDRRMTKLAAIMMVSHAAIRNIDRLRGGAHIHHLKAMIRHGRNVLAHDRARGCLTANGPLHNKRQGKQAYPERSNGFDRLGHRQKIAHHAPPASRKCGSRCNPTPAPDQNFFLTLTAHSRGRAGCALA